MNKLTKKQFYACTEKSELINQLTGEHTVIFKMYYLPNNHCLFNFTIKETSKLKAWYYFKIWQNERLN